jgi:CRP/FNR family transcriptional regulator, cyclic AMP receptor protein
MLRANNERIAMARHKTHTFNAQAFLHSAGIARRIAHFRKRDIIFTQGDLCDSVMYLQQGDVKLSVVSTAGKEAVVALVGPGDFLGEGALTGQPTRMATAKAVTPVTLLEIDKKEMFRVLHAERTLADRFITYMLERNGRVEADLIDQLFNSSEKRLARTLLLLAHYGKKDRLAVIPKIPQETLAEMIGTTRSRVNFFMNRFRDRGFISYDGDIKINDSLLSVILRD